MTPKDYIAQQVRLYLAGFMALLLALAIIGMAANWGLSRQYRAWEIDRRV